MISSCTQPTATGTVLRRQRDGTRISVPCPQSIISCNSYMGGVDRGDQLCGYYSCKIKSRKFYKYIFFFLFDVAITNAYILHKNYTPEPKPRNMKEFRLRLATGLIGDYCTKCRPGRRSSTIVPLPNRHFPVKGNETEPSKKRGRCAWCSQLHKRSDVTWFCQECNVWLCHGGIPSTNCFLLWHKNIKS